MKNKDDFNFWVPIDIEKSKNEKEEIVMKIKGIASTPDEDSEGEILEPVGFDLDRFLKVGFINWNHQAKNDASKIIGEPTVAKVNKRGELYVEGTLYNDHPLAKSVWELGEVLERNNSKRKLGFSIEGRALQRDTINPKRITKALITGLAITPTPVNASSYLDIVKGTQKEDYVSYAFEEDNDLHEAKDVRFLYEFGVNGVMYGVTKSFDCVEIEKAEDIEECSGSDIEKSPDAAAKAKIKKVMHEFKNGELKTSAGKVVTDRKQAIAIAMSEAGISDKSFDEYMNDDDGVEKTMDVASTAPLVPEDLDKKVRVLEPVIKKAIQAGIIPMEGLNKISKALGEGSRGGVIVGRTRSGRPIYASSELGKKMAASFNVSTSEHRRRINRLKGEIAKYKKMDEGKESGQKHNIKIKELQQNIKDHEEMIFNKR